MTPANITYPLLVVMLAGVAAPVAAVSLGPVRGNAIIGRTFDVTAVAQLAPNEVASGLCVASDVVFGETAIAPHRVTTSVSPGTSPGEALIRIRTSVAVDEPVVTVTLREGCEQKNSRKYVFFAEVMTAKTADRPLVSPIFPKIASSAPRALAQGTPGAATAVVEGASNATPSTSSTPAPGSTRQRRKADADRKSSAMANVTAVDVGSARQIDRVAGLSAKAVAKAAIETSAKASRARLKLDPIDLSVPERDPVLRVSSELLTQPAADPQQRAAAAALWQALNAQPQDILRDGQRLKTLEDNVAKMLAQNSLTNQAVTDLRVQLEQSRSERFNNWLVYTLAGLLLLASAVAAYVLLRRDRSSPWWGKSSAAEAFELDEAIVQGPVSIRARQSAPAPMAPPARFENSFRFDAQDTGDSLHSGLGAALLGPSPSSQEIKIPEPIAARDRLDFSVSMPRIVNAEELFDVQQQADFFVSLGDYNKAAEILRLHITDNVETSALTYLDLFALYHQLGRREDYELLSEEFSRTFNAHLPTFDHYKTDTEGLEFYDSILSRIVEEWPTPKVLEVIESSIFRKPDSKSEVFSLAAYRDLLLLHAIAKKVVDPTAVRKTLQVAKQAKSQEPGFVNTSIQPASAQWDAPRPAYASDPTRPPLSPNVGVDIDLTELEYSGDMTFELDVPEISAAPAVPPPSDHQRPSIDIMLEPLDFELFPMDRPPSK